MTNYITNRNNMAMDNVAKVLGLEDPITIWFCHEVELDPEMNETKLTNLMTMALEADDWDDEE